MMCRSMMATHFIWMSRCLRILVFDHAVINPRFVQDLTAFLSMVVLKARSDWAYKMSRHGRITLTRIHPLVGPLAVLEEIPVAVTCAVVLDSLGDVRLFQGHKVGSRMYPK